MIRKDTFRILYPNPADGFKALFEQELDSWFDADIACCSACYDKFCSQWPLLYLRSVDFQRSGIEIGSFYSGSLMSEFFTEYEFRQHADKMGCPRCGAPLKGRIWPYSFKFETPPDFESLIAEIGEIGRKTPFLVSKHRFAQQVLDEIARIAPVLPRLNLGIHYRGRRRSPSIYPTPEAFFSPVADQTAEGRYNHAGIPVLYLATDRNTCFSELGGPNEGIFVAGVKIMHPQKILDLRDERFESTVLLAVLNSSLLSASTSSLGWHQPHYVFSRFVADCARASGVDGLRYPSVRCTCGDNLVLFGNSGAWGDEIEIERIEEYTGCLFCYPRARCHHQK